MSVPFAVLRHASTDWNVAAPPAGPDRYPAQRRRRGRCPRAGACRRRPMAGSGFSSPLQRARRTAELMQPSAPVIVDSALREMSFGTWEGHTIAELRETRRRRLHRRREQGIGLPAARRGIAARRHGPHRPLDGVDRRQRAARRRGVAQGHDPRPAGAGHRLGHDGPAAAQARLALPAFLLGPRRRPRLDRSPQRAADERASSSTCSICWASAICAAPPCWRARWRPAASTCCWSRAARRSRDWCWAARASTSCRRCARPTRACAISPGSTAAPVDEAFQRQRTDGLLGLLRAEAPDVVLTEQFPFGRTRLRFELLPLLEAARGLPKRPLIACSVRDVVRRARPERVAETEQILRALVRCRADPWRPRASYLSREASPAGRASRSAPSIPAMSRSAIWRRAMHSSAEGKDEVVVSVGGGAVGAPLLKAAVAARPKTALADRHVATAGGREPAGAGPAPRLPARRASIIEPARADFTTLARATPRSRSPRPATTP